MMNSLTKLSEKELEVIKMCNSFKLKGLSGSLQCQFENPKPWQNCSFEERLLAALSDHSDYLRKRRHEILLKKANIKGQRTSDEIDTGKDRGITKTEFETLCQLGFIRQAKNVIIRGPSGSGKTELISAIAKVACRAGYTTSYYITNDLIFEYLTQSADNKNKIRTQLKKTFLLILDDLCLTPFKNNDEAKVLYDILNDRIDEHATIFATQLTDSGIKKRLEPVDSALCDALYRRISNCMYEYTIINPKESKGDICEN